MTAPRIEIGEARLHHCGQMARSLRAPTREGMAALGFQTHRELRKCVEASSEPRAAFVDGKLAAMWGMSGSLLDPEGYVWLAVNDVATQYPVRLVREAMRGVDGFLKSKQILWTRILGSDAASQRFARRLGFFTTHPLPMDPNALARMEMRAGARQALVPRGETRPFVVFTAGRSRTNWLANFLTYGEVRCHAEVSRTFRSLDGVQAFLVPGVGMAETGIAPAWRLVKHRVPSLKMVVIRRDADEIIESFLKTPLGPHYDVEKLRRIVAYECRCLDQISYHPDALTVRFEDLGFAFHCKRIFEHCLPHEFDLSWWKFMSGRHIEPDARDVARYYLANREGVETFKREAKREMIRLVRSGELAA
jgi:hypothetical protein